VKTKYSQLLKVKKQKVDGIENKIALLNAQKNKIAVELEVLKREINDLKLPKEGKFGQFVTASFAFEKLMGVKKEKEKEIDSKNSQIIEARNEYKMALMEYEKIKYLEDLIIKEKLAKIKKDEQKLLDEISVLTYKRRVL